ncbi:P-loop containing nucleoside triphosphate hydrolase protein [Usnea florida]
MATSDINNFSSSSPHRLPTVSATQTLHDSSSTSKRPISTGLRSLDVFLQGRESETSSQLTPPVGVSRGEVTEIYGPPGVGKTALAIQTAASALQSGGSVVWVDSSSEIVGSRLMDILYGTFNTEEHGKSNTVSVEECLERFHHFITPSLPYLLALLTHQTSDFPPEETTLIVVDSISTLFALAFPRTAENASSQQTPVKQGEAAQWASGRRWAVMGDLISKISRLAATKNIAVLLTSQMTTRIRSETGAVLQPAISGTAWDTGVSARIVIFRDWMFRASEDTSSQGEYIPGVRCAGLLKAKGMSYEGVGKVVTFVIENSCLREIAANQTDIRISRSPVLPPTSLKRKREGIADSELEDEDAESDREFGWAGNNDAITSEALLD